MTHLPTLGPAFFNLVHDPEEWACNMGWAVLDNAGDTLYRGPEWAARFRATTPRHEWPEVARWAADADALGAILAAVQEA